MNIYERYAEIKTTIKLLEEEQKGINKQILNELEQAKADKVEFEFGKFTRATKTSWKYTDKITSLEEKVKIAKVTEQEKGLAKQVESHYLTFTQPKQK